MAAVEKVLAERADVFEHFLRLPAEIRAEIWTLAVLEPRKVYIHHHVNECPEGTFSEVRFHSNTTNPATLSTNRESRCIALKFYHESFIGIRKTYDWNSPECMKKITTHLRERPNIFVNHDIDRIYCNIQDLLCMSGLDCAKIRMLDLHHRTKDSAFDCRIAYRKISKYFMNLKVLNVQADDAGISRFNLVFTETRYPDWLVPDITVYENSIGRRAWKNEGRGKWIDYTHVDFNDPLAENEGTVVNNVLMLI